jgi:hypothetical protein
VILAETPSEIAFITPPRTAEDNLCSSPVILESRDVFGNTSSVTTTVAVSYSKSPASFIELHLDPDCAGSTAVSTAFFPGTSTATVYFRGTRARVTTLFATAFGFSVTQALTVRSACGGDCTCATGCCRQSCVSMDCTFACNVSTCGCVFDCNANSGVCDAECRAGSTCTMDCRSANECDLRCREGSVCALSCENALRCDSVRCEGGSQCILECAGADRCGFQSCEGGSVGSMSCPGAISVCNRDCP